MQALLPGCPECENEKTSAVDAVCPACRCVFNRCRICGTANKSFAVRCRACGKPLVMTHGSWTHYKGSASRPGGVDQVHFDLGQGNLGLRTSGSLGEPAEGGIVTAFGMAYVVTEAGRLIEFHQNELRRGRGWIAQGVGEKYKSSPVIADQRIFVNSTNTVDLFFLRGSADSEWTFHVDPPRMIRDESLVVGANYLAFETYQTDGGLWKLHVFRWEQGKIPSPLWECEIPGGALTIPLIVRDHIVVLSQEGGAHVFNPNAGPAAVASNRASHPPGYKPVVHPLADGDLVVAVGNEGLGFGAMNQCLVRFNMSRSSLRANKVVSVHSEIVESIVKTQSGYAAAFASGFRAWTQAGSQVQESPNPAGLSSEPPLAVGPLLILASGGHGRLYPYRLDAASVNRGEAYPDSPGPSPYISVVPSFDGLLALRKDGVLESLAFS